MNLLVLFVALPLLGAFALPIIGKFIKRGYDLLAIAITAALLLAIAGLYARPLQLPFVYAIGGWRAPFGIVWLLDHLSMFMLLVVNAVTFFITVYSVNYMERYTAKCKYYTLLLLMLAGLNGVILTGDLFNLFVFLEITAISGYALVAFGTQAEEIEASFKYMVLGSIASAFVLLGIAFLYAKASTLNMFDMAGVLASCEPSSRLILLVTALFITGFGLKTALVPFHAWLPDAHPSAPAPISAMLSGLVIKVTGVYALGRIIFNVFGLNFITSEILLALGALSMLAGVILAIGQWDFKRLLAYHSISQIGYVICGIGLGTPWGIVGGLFHLLNHSVFKSLLFLNAGSVEYAANTRQLKELGGLHGQMPCTSWSSLAASLSIAGIPPFCGFWSKLIIIIALLMSGRFFYAIVAVLVGVITLASFLKIQKYVFYRKISDTLSKVKEAPVFMCISMISLAVLCLLIGLLFHPIIKWVLLPAARVLLGGQEYFLGILGA